MSREGINAVVEVALPLRISHAWIAFACQKAGLKRPRWDHEARVWTALPDSRNGDAIRITSPAGDRTMRVEGDAASEEQVRRFVTAVLTGMFQRTRRSAESVRR
jgi:hypothetical protein